LEVIMPKSFRSRITAVVVAVGALTPAQFSRAQHTSTVAGAPIFQIDPGWPTLPHHWVTGPVAWVASGPNGHIWVFHRPRLVSEDKRASAAPPILEFDETGVFVKGWGGDGRGYDWPTTEHGLYVDYKGNIWLTGSSPNPAPSPNSPTDNMLLKFSRTGAFLLQIGGRGQLGGNKDTKNLDRATDVAVYPKTNEVFVADGYGNRRVIVFDAATGAFKRMWGAFGKPVDVDPPPPPGPTSRAPIAAEGDGPERFGNPVHCVKVSNDGLVYVCDRTNRRIQVFTVDGKYITQVFINRTADPSAAGLAFSADAQQRYLYVADYGSSHVAVLDRKSLRTLYEFGKRGARAGDFEGLHSIAVDKKGNLFTAEVVPGNRAQRFIFKGMGVPASTGFIAEPHLASVEERK
jgi:DNA-binding beta-propeller fold protein YncE